MAPLEIEIKLRVPDLQVVRERLLREKAEFLERVLETNVILDREDGFLMTQGCGLRLRSARDESSGGTRAVLTYKGPREPGPVKTREEVEVNVGDAGQAYVLLDRLGFAELLWYQKRRESWSLGGCRVELDEAPHIGTFVEIEGPGEPAIRAVQKQLALETAEVVQDSYVRMLLAWCQAHGKSDYRLPLA